MTITNKHIIDKPSCQRLPTVKAVCFSNNTANRHESVTYNFNDRSIQRRKKKYFLRTGDRPLTASLTNNHVKIIQSSILRFSKADIIIGGLEESTSEYFISSKPYYYDKLTWCVQAKQPIPLWQNLFYLCLDPIIWAIHTTTSICLMSTAYFIQQFDSPRMSDWHTLLLVCMALAAGFPCTYKAKSTSNRVLHIIGIFGSMIFNIVILSFVLRITVNPIYETQTKSIRGIIDGSFELIGDRFAFEHMRKQHEVRLFAVISEFF